MHYVNIVMLAFVYIDDNLTIPQTIKSTHTHTHSQIDTTHAHTNMPMCAHTE